MIYIGVIVENTQSIRWTLQMSAVTYVIGMKWLYFLIYVEYG